MTLNVEEALRSTSSDDQSESFTSSTRRSTGRDGSTETGGSGQRRVGGGGGGGGGGRGGHAIGRNLERATKVAGMETTAGVGERRQLARVYTTALCSRRPHRAVSSRASRTFLFVRTPRSLPRSLRLSLSLFSSLLFSSHGNAPMSFCQRQLLPSSLLLSPSFLLAYLLTPPDNLMKHAPYWYP